MIAAYLGVAEKPKAEKPAQYTDFDAFARLMKATGGKMPGG